MKKTIVLMIGAIFILTGHAAAQDSAPFDRDAYIKSAAIEKTLEIAMVDCVAMSLKNNSEIQVREIFPRIEDANVRIQKSVFEPHLSFDFLMESSTDLSVTTLTRVNPTKIRTGIFNFGFDEKFVTGTTVELDFANTRTNTNSLIESQNPSFDSEAMVTITQPLLKGFGIIVNKADFLIAKNNKLKSDQDLTKQIIDILTEVKIKYYELQYTQEQYKVAQASLERIENLHLINKERYAKGLASNVDLLNSESELAQTAEKLLEAEENMSTAEDNLKYITNLVDDPALWNARIKLLSELSYEEKDPDLVESITKAFSCRPDYEAAKIGLKNKGISVIFFRNNMLPTLDLTGAFGLNGLGQTYSKDLGHLGGGKYEDWYIGVTFKMPFFSDEEKGKYEKSKLDKVMALIEFKRLEQKIILQVRDAVRAVDIKYRMLEASITSKKAEEENYSAQETRFRAGLVSTLDMVIYYERLTRTQVNYVKSVIDYNISFLELARAMGTTLIEDGIRLEN